MMQLSHIFKDYSNDGVVTKVLHDVSFIIESGEFVSIMGPSGSGKSTLMHIIGFLDRPTSGDYFFQDANVAQFSDDALANLRNERIGFVFQAFHLLPNTTVFENVLLPLMYSSRDESERGNLVNAAIESVGLSHRRDHLSHQLSGGEKQRVAIARALVNEPDFILADEPTGNLDSKSGASIMAILQKLNHEGKTILVVTHENLTAQHAKRIIRIRDGMVEADELVNNHIRAMEKSSESSFQLK
ncbi:ABC transporter ATP-binding protein [Candidatus Peregrinibacteria bacterium]|nr:ABC transporter ATP-binding protein [Candidatus Peregrinibacteria bacterium]